MAMNITADPRGQAGIVYADRLFDAARFLSAPDPAAALVTAMTAGEGLMEIMPHPAWNRDTARGAAEVALLTNPRLRAALDEWGSGECTTGK